MANETFVTVIGRLVDDLAARVTQTGKAMATGSIATSERHYNRQTQQWEDGDPSYYNLTLFDPDASYAMSSFRKGDRVIVHGKLRVRNFQRSDGSRGTSADLTVTEMGPSIKFNEVAINRQNGGGGGFQQQQQQGSGFQQQPQQQQPQQQSQGNQQAPQDDPWSGGGQQAAQDDPFTNAGPADNGQDNSAGGWW